MDDDVTWDAASESLSSASLDFSDDRRSEAAVYAAHKYYLHNWTMEYIARTLGTSRSTVSRLLQAARRSGIVEIRIMSPDVHTSPLRRSLESKFNIRAHVAVSPGGSTPAERHERTASAAARMISALVESDMTVGVSWGTMVNAVSQSLIPKVMTNVQIVQLNGMGFSRTSNAHHSHTIMDAFGKAYDASICPYPVPLFFDEEQSRECLLMERSIHEIREKQRCSDMLVFSVGTVEEGVPSAPYLTGYHLDTSDFVQLKEEGVVGDVATTFMRSDGESASVSMNRRTSGPDLGWLPGIRYRICAVSGEHKVPALRAALRANLVTDLVVDDGTARALLQSESD